MIDEEDDIINTIKKAFNIENTPKRNHYGNVDVSGAEYVKVPDDPIDAEPTPQPDYIRDEDILPFFYDAEPPKTPLNLGRVEGTIVAPKPIRPENPAPASISTEITAEVAVHAPIAATRQMELF